MALQISHRLIKFMSLILSDDYILDRIGPFWSTVTDGTIANSITNACDALMKWYENDD